MAQAYSLSVCVLLYRFFLDHDWHLFYSIVVFYPHDWIRTELELIFEFIILDLRMNYVAVTVIGCFYVITLKCYLSSLFQKFPKDL